MPQASSLLGQIRRWIGWRSGEDQSDHELLTAFVERQDSAAFEGLMQRHGPAVLGVCQRVLGSSHDAEDAFQAAFLVLARKAGSIRQGEALAGWLCRVATRIALAARSGRARRQAQERQVTDMLQAEPAPEHTWQELRPILDEEVDRLPSKYRVPIVLCYFEGRSHEEAARLLGWPKGTVAGRLARARDMLRQRLVRRGLEAALATLTALLGDRSMRAAVPPALIDGTLHNASLFALGQPVNSAVSLRAVSLAEGALRTMNVTKLKIVAAVLVSIAVAGVGTGIYLQSGPTTTAAAYVPVEEAPKIDLTKIDPAVFQAFNQAEAAFTAKIEDVQSGPVGLSDPPLYNWNIRFQDLKMLRGTKPVDPVFRYSYRGREVPKLTPGDRMLVAANVSGQDLRITAMVPAGEAEIAAARVAVTYPIGWTLEAGKVVSPWASLGEKAKLPGLEGNRACAKTGRPALLAGPDVEMVVERIMPKQVQEFKNPYG
ncbi:MAG: RNA polymerase sigma factor, partial [Gemmataceae bacterium]